MSMFKSSQDKISFADIFTIMLLIITIFLCSIMLIFRSINKEINDCIASVVQWIVLISAVYANIGR